MNYKDLSLRYKVATSVVLLVSIGIVITITVTTARTRDIVIEEVRNTTLPGYRDTVLNALTMMMISGTIRDAKRPFLEQMSHIGNVRVISSGALDSQFGKGEEFEYPSDDSKEGFLRQAMRLS